MKFVGHTNTYESGGQGELTHYDYQRGHFKICLSPLKLICIANAYPVVEKQQYYNGETWHRVRGDSN